MSEDLSPAVHLAVLEKAHRQAVEDVMQSDMGDVERVVRILVMEAEYLGTIEMLRAAHEAEPSRGQGDSTDSRVAMAPANTAAARVVTALAASPFWGPLAVSYMTDIPALVRLARATMANIRQNVALAIPDDLIEDDRVWRALERAQGSEPARESEPAEAQAPRPRAPARVWVQVRVRVRVRVQAPAQLRPGPGAWRRARPCG